jgi:hypothetical protein
VAIVAAGMVLRFVASSALWLDEALAVNVSTLPLSEIPAALERDGLPPLYYGSLHLWMSVFGEGDLAVRAWSGLLSVLALPLMYLAGARLGGRRLGAIALALLALNPYAIRYATEARMYALIVLLVLVGFILLHDSLRRPTWLRLGGVALVSGALLLTHYWAFWLVGAVALCLAWSAWKDRDRDERAGAGRSLLAVLAGGVLFLPWLPTFLTQATHTATPWAAASRPTTVLAVTLEDFGGIEVAEAKLLGFLLGLLFLLGVFGRREDDRLVLDLRTAPQVRSLTIVVVLTLALGTAASLVTDNAFAGRYASVVVPLFLLVASAGLTRVPGRLPRGVLLGATVALGLVVSLHHAAEDRTQAAELAAAIELGAPDGQSLGTPLVVYCPDQLGPSVSRLLPERGVEQVVYPVVRSEAVESPYRVDWWDYAERHAAADPAAFADDVLALAGDENGIWVVSSPSYRTVEGQCDEVVQQLAEARTGMLVVAEDGADSFEHASLQLFLPAAP